MTNYQQDRYVAQQLNIQLAKSDTLVRVLGRDFMRLVRYTIDGKRRVFIEPVYIDKDGYKHNYH